MKKLKARACFKASFRKQVFGAKLGQGGFIPMIICLLLLIVAVLYVSYHFVAKAQH